tara:strand:- start:721 stop:876 length:156 start_codon:yes stop_codon:yes gene_type:complete
MLSAAKTREEQENYSPTFNVNLAHLLLSSMSTPKKNNATALFLRSKMANDW